MKKLLFLLLGLFSTAMFADGVGRFDSIGGAYDEQTDFDFQKMLYYQMYTQSLISNLAARPGGTPGMRAFSGGLLSPVIKRTKITIGDMLRYTMAEAVRGLVTYGDKQPSAGGFLQFKNREARVNSIKSPAFQVVGKMSQQRASGSITNIPETTKQQAISFGSEEMEFQAIGGILHGASDAALKTTANGGLGVSLGVGSGGGAGVPLMCKNFFTPDDGFLTYSTTVATYNSTVNTAINDIDAAAADMFTLAFHQKIRARLDDIKWESVSYGGKQYKAIAPCDPEIMWRLKRLLGAIDIYSDTRGLEQNRYYHALKPIELDEILYFSWPNMKKYRPAYNATTVRPDFGPLTAGTDPRDYSTTSSIGMVHYLGAEALWEGFNDQLKVTWNHAPHDGPQECVVHMMEAFGRSEWYAKDGRTDVAAVENRNSLTACFYEPGVGLDA